VLVFQTQARLSLSLVLHPCLSCTIPELLRDVCLFISAACVRQAKVFLQPQTDSQIRSETVWSAGLNESSFHEACVTLMKRCGVVRTSFTVFRLECLEMSWALKPFAPPAPGQISFRISSRFIACVTRALGFQSRVAGRFVLPPIETVGCTIRQRKLYLLN